MSKNTQNVDLLGVKKDASAVAKIQREQAAFDAGFRYKADTAPKGSAMFAYTQAVLLKIGGLSKPFRSAVLSGMYGSNTVISHHTKQGNIEKTDTAGMVRLTAKGQAYFTGRAMGKVVGQAVEHGAVVAMSRAMMTGEITAGTLAAQITWRKIAG